VYALLLISSLYISVVDVAIHEIRNRTLAIIGTVFAAITLVGNGEIYLVSALAMFLIGILGLSFGLGAGDVKLATLLALFFLPLEISKWSDLCNGFIVAGAVLLISHLILRKSLADPIALAPALCAAFIWCAR
jgi:Flp pilus assembly protein protease CpaA